MIYLVKKNCFKDVLRIWKFWFLLLARSKNAFLRTPVHKNKKFEISNFFLKIVLYSRYFCKFTFYSLEWENFWSRAKRLIQFAHVWAIYFCAWVRMFCSRAKRGSKFSHECINSWWNWKTACNIIFFITVF